MSNGVASAGTSSGSSTNTNTAAGSTHRRISHEQAARSTCAPARVAHLIGRRPSSARRSTASLAAPRDRREVVPALDPLQLPTQPGHHPSAHRLRLGFAGRGLSRDRGIFGGDGDGHPPRHRTLLRRRSETRQPDPRLPSLQYLLGQPLELLPRRARRPATPPTRRGSAPPPDDEASATPSPEAPTAHAAADRPTTPTRPDRPHRHPRPRNHGYTSTLHHRPRDGRLGKDCTTLTRW